MHSAQVESEQPATNSALNLMNAAATGLSVAAWPTLLQLNPTNGWTWRFVPGLLLGFGLSFWMNLGNGKKVRA